MKRKWIIIISVAAAALLLTGAWFLGGNEQPAVSPTPASASPSPEETASPSPAPTGTEADPSPSESAPAPSASAEASQDPEESASPSASSAPPNSSAAPTNSPAANSPNPPKEEPPQNTPSNEPAPEPEPSVPPSASPSPSPETPPADEEKQAQCTIVVECTQVLSAMDSLKEEKRDIIPQDGIILAEQTIDLTEGDTPFDILRRETKRNKIQMQFSRTPLTGSVYVEGIGNLNEFDCGGTSGWVYSVNGETPSVSAGEYVLEDGDVVRWYYSLSENASGLE